MNARQRTASVRRRGHQLTAPRGASPTLNTSAARDRHGIEQHVVQFANAGRHEPLQPLVEDADRECRERRKHQRRDIAALVPRPVIQPGERTVLDEVKPLDDINVRIAGCRGPRVERASADGDREQAVSRARCSLMRSSAETTAIATAATTMPPMMIRYWPGRAS